MGALIPDGLPETLEQLRGAKRRHLVAVAAHFITTHTKEEVDRFILGIKTEAQADQWPGLTPEERTRNELEATAEVPILQENDGRDRALQILEEDLRQKSPYLNEKARSQIIEQTRKVLLRIENEEPMHDPSSRTMYSWSDNVTRK